MGNAPTVSSSGGGAICPGNSLTLSSATSGGASCSYQWQISSNGSGGPWINIGGATSSTYNTGALTATRWYRVQRICTGGGCDDPISNVQQVTVANPTITQGSDQNVCQGTGLTLSLSSALGGATALSYQWQNASSVSGPWSNITGATGASYNSGALNATTYYRVLGTATGTACVNPVSNVQTITLVPTPVVSVSGGGVVCTNSSVPLTATVTDAGAVTFSYQWRKSTAGPTGPWTNVGTNSATYQTENLTTTAYYQAELIGNFPSGCIPVLSNTETVTVECCGFNNIIYVNASAPGANNGTSWANAFHYLQDALAIAGCSNITQIWVAAGTYYPDDGGGQTAGDRAASFLMRNNLAILGGFPNAGTPGLGQRNWASNPTILSGDIGTPNNQTDNSYHVIYNNFNAPNIGLNNTAVLDGFTIREGNGADYGGGGMYNLSSSPAVNGCTFTSNMATHDGGGMYNFNGSSPNITGCTFTGNSVNLGGGGMYATASSNPTVLNCAFLGNSAAAASGTDRGNGGGMFNEFGSYMNFTNCIFLGNSASTDGGGLYRANQYTPNLVNCIFRGNSTEIGIGFQFTTPSISSSIVKGGCPTGFNCTNILDVNPLFVGQPPVGLGATGDLHLDSCSPAIDAGTASGAPSNELEGNSRPANAGYDLGAYEFQGTVSTPLVCYLDGDNDGFGNAAMSMNFCGACGTGYVANSTDCDDMDAAINPGAVEVCRNNIDDNCNNQVDEGCCDLAITNTSSTGETCPNMGDGGITVAATSGNGRLILCRVDSRTGSPTGISAKSRSWRWPVPANSYPPKTKASRRYLSTHP